MLESKDAAIWVVSGWRGVGKTTYCRQLIALALSRGLDVAGLLSPARFSNGSQQVDSIVKTGIEVEDLRTGQRRLLASNIDGELRGPQLGPWTFDANVFAWGNSVLESAIPCDVLIIDELGPLEFDQRQGWVIGFDLIEKRRYRLAIIVVRPEYLAIFQQRWPEAKPISL